MSILECVARFKLIVKLDFKKIHLQNVITNLQVVNPRDMVNSFCS